MIERPPACQIGPRGCHGCAAWCDDCGDVGDVCPDFRNCDCHYCTTCGQCGLIRDYECGECCDRREYVAVHGTAEERAEMRMLDVPGHSAFAVDFADIGRIGRPSHPRGPA